MWRPLVRPRLDVWPGPQDCKKRRGWLGGARVTCATLACLLMMQAASFSQDVTEPSLKAAFIYNFVLFTEWPAGVLRAAGPIVLCVLGDDAVQDALERTSKGRVHDGHLILVMHVAPTGSRGCQVLYISGMATTQAEQLVAGLRDFPVLTISDMEGFTQLGGIAQFFFEHGQLRFTVQNASAQRAHLQISSRLLALARPR